MGHVPKVNMDRDYRLVAISKKMSYFLQGGAFKDAKPHPPFRGIDLSVEFDALVRHLNDRIANVMPWEVMICIRNNNTRRFRVMVGPPPLGEASWKGLPYQALRVRAVQGHHNELTRKYTEQAILTNLYRARTEREPSASRARAGHEPGTNPARSVRDPCAFRARSVRDPSADRARAGQTGHEPGTIPARSVRDPCAFRARSVRDPGRTGHGPNTSLPSRAPPEHIPSRALIEHEPSINQAQARTEREASTLRVATLPSSVASFEHKCLFRFRRQAAAKPCRRGNIVSEFTRR